MVSWQAGAADRVVDGREEGMTKAKAKRRAGLTPEEKAAAKRAARWVNYDGGIAVGWVVKGRKHY